MTTLLLLVTVLSIAVSVWWFWKVKFLSSRVSPVILWGKQKEKRVENDGVSVTESPSPPLQTFNPLARKPARPAFSTFDTLANNGAGGHYSGRSYVVNGYQGLKGTEPLYTAQPARARHHDVRHNGFMKPYNGNTTNLADILTSPQHLYSIRVDNIPTYQPYDVVTSSAFQDLLLLNDSAFSKDEVWSFQWLTQTGMTNHTLLIHLTDGIAMTRLIQKGLKITEGYKTLDAVEYIVPLTQCNHCSQFEGLDANCQTAPPACGICAGDHLTADLTCCTATSRCPNPLECTHAVRHCILCYGEHAALDKTANCPARMRAVEIELGPRMSLSENADYF